LGEITESGGAACRDAIGSEGLHDASDGAVNLFLARNVAGEAGEIGGEFILDGGTEAFEGGVGAAQAVAGRESGVAAEASIGIFKIAKVVR